MNSSSWKIYIIRKCEEEWVKGKHTMQAGTTYLDDDDFATIVNTLEETHKWTFTTSLDKHIDDKS